MEIKKIKELPKRNYRVSKYIDIVNEFTKSKAKFVELELDEDEDLLRAYNSLYQAASRTGGVKATRIVGKLYLVKVNENGEEL